MQLSEVHGQFEALGIQVAAMSYDSNETSREFAERHDIRFPILADENARHVLAFGILNEQYEPGHRAYGIPHPGIFLVDGDGMIVAKFAEDNYRERPDLTVVLEAARKMTTR